MEKYISTFLCGFPITNVFFAHFIDRNEQKMPTDTPTNPLKKKTCTFTGRSKYWCNPFNEKLTSAIHVGKFMQFLYILMEFPDKEFHQGTINKYRHYLLSPWVDTEDNKDIKIQNLIGYNNLIFYQIYLEKMKVKMDFTQENRQHLNECKYYLPNIIKMYLKIRKVIDSLSTCQNCDGR